MAAYPQLATGALAQFPVKKRRRTRTLENALEDGSAIRLADPGAEITQWELVYNGLSDQEAAALREFFESCEGTLNGFTFVDPVANLLEQSGSLDATVWAKAPLISLRAGIADPAGGTAAWRASNAGAARQWIRQTLATPGAYVYCLSAYLRSAQGAEAVLTIGDGAFTAATGPEWRRFCNTGSGAPTGNEVAFGLEVGAGATVEVYGMQAEAQPAPSTYKPTTQTGVYEDARFAADELAMQTTAENSHAATVRIIHAKHL